jgi:tetratricopeptide (TPR) repeat protein
VKRIACLLSLAVCASIVPPAFAQHAAFRIKGKVRTETGAPIGNAEVRAEAFYGYAAGTFAGQRTFAERTNAKGDWSIGALQPGVWIFEVLADGYVPESVILPPRILATVSQGTSGMAMTWDLVLKPIRFPDGSRGQTLKTALDAVLAGKADDARSTLLAAPDDADADYLASAGRVAMLARDMPAAAALFRRALERDPASYRAALGIASSFLYQRDFDGASRAFDAARSRTHDKDEQKFITAAIGELQAIRYR